eukprot:TRINITY_DN23138_c0_g1_i1.p1 TRINITY_DN23138_c0_g1~~TRINITY_DN23138_c0_g1_i1.p1  ORF type:complete len:468 (-),score=48.85 TRINITY_DN23138_c0_g1_i1:100-1503(-)
MLRMQHFPLSLPRVASVMNYVGGGDGGVAKTNGDARGYRLEGRRGSVRSRMAAISVALLWFVAAVPRGTALLYKVDAPAMSDKWFLLGIPRGWRPNTTVSVDLYNNKPANGTLILVLTESQSRTHSRTNHWSTSFDAPVGKKYPASTWRSDFRDHVKASFQLRAASTERYYLAISNIYGRTLGLSGTINLVGPDGEQLPAEFRYLPAVYLTSSIICFASFALFLCVVRIVSYRASTPIHLIIASSFFLQGLATLTVRTELLQIDSRGTSDTWISFAASIMIQVRSASELVMLLLIALGYRTLRLTLSQVEVRFVTIVLAMFSCIAMFSALSTSTQAEDTYDLGRDILIALSSVVIIVGMNLNVQRLSQQLQDSPISIDTGETYIKRRAYVAFRWVVLAFILKPEFDQLLGVVLPWEDVWVSLAIVELRAWITCMVIAFFFFPRSSPPRVFELARDVLSGDEDVVDGA